MKTATTVEKISHNYCSHGKRVVRNWHKEMGKPERITARRIVAVLIKKHKNGGSPRLAYSMRLVGELMTPNQWERIKRASKGRFNPWPWTKRRYSKTNQIRFNSISL